MTQQREKVKVDLIPVLLTLEDLAKTEQKMKNGKPLFDGQFLTIPKDFPVDFMDAAEAAVDYVNGLPKEHPASEVLNVDKVNEGYRLLQSGEVNLFYLNQP